MATEQTEPIYKATDSPKMIDLAGNGELLIRTPYGLVRLFLSEEHQTLKVVVQAVMEDHKHGTPTDGKRWNMQIEAVGRDHIMAYIARFPYKGEEFGEG